MSRTFLARLSAAALLLAGCWIAFTQTQTPPKLTISKVKDDLYMIEGDGGNVAVYVTSEGVILVDDKYDQDHDAIVTQVKTVSDLPVKYILSTHYHADHSGGNAKFLSTRDTGLIQEGKSQDDVGKVMTAEFGWAPTSMQMQWSLPGMMKELK